MPFTLPQVAALVSVVAGVPVALACDITPQEPYDGFVAFPDWIHPERLIHLRPGICVRLMHAQEGAGISPADWLVVTHEAEHIALSSTNECVVERTALANVWALVKLFRLAAWRARIIMDGVSYADAAMPSQYHEGC